MRAELKKWHAVMGAIAMMQVASAMAGTLTPPPGPVSATMKPLDQVEPRIAINATNTPGDANNVYVITQSGSYYLTGALNVPAGKNGIRIDTWEVTIDLNGFTIYGSAGSLDGITWGNGLDMITIKNGVVDNCGGDGIDLSNAWSSLVSHVTFIDNGGNGLKVFYAIVDHCIAQSNGQTGFVSGGGCLFTDCISFSNNNGFVAGGGDRFDHCSAGGNVAVGLGAGSYTTVACCTLTDNTLQGIVCGDECTVTGNICRHNGSSGYAGIWAQGNKNRIESNDSLDNGFGIYVSGTGNLIIRNTASGSTQSNYYIVAGNHAGTILQPSTNATLINGNSGGGLGTSDPNANFVN